MCQVPNSMCYLELDCCTLGIVAYITFEVNCDHIPWEVMVSCCSWGCLLSLGKGKDVFLIDWWSWLFWSFIFYRMSSVFFFFFHARLLSFKFLTIVSLSNSNFLWVCFLNLSINFWFVYLQYHTMRNILFMAMTEFQKVKFWLWCRFCNY